MNGKSEQMKSNKFNRNIWVGQEDQFNHGSFPRFDLSIFSLFSLFFFFFTENQIVIILQHSSNKIKIHRYLPYQPHTNPILDSII